MYEHMTYEAIIKRALSRVTSQVDKRQGSALWDALAPACAELAKAYIELDNVLNQSFIQTASGKYVDLLANEQNITRLPATKAVRKGIFTGSGGQLFSVPLGSRFSIDGIGFTVTGHISGNEYTLECEQAGIAGNTCFGKLMPIDPINGLASAELDGEVLIFGEDEESDKSIVQRYFTGISNVARDGNMAQYRKWASEFPGLGRAKIFPLYYGPNTVKISITGSDGKPASQALIEAFQDYIDPGITGLGNGAAPCGVFVTVTAGDIRKISLSADITLANGYTEPEGAREALEKYFGNIAFVSSYIDYIETGATLLNVESIARVQNLKLNSATQDIILESEDVPVLENLELQAVT